MTPPTLSELHDVVKVRWLPTWARIALIVALLVSGLRLDAPPPVSAGSASWSGQTVQAFGGVWSVQQSVGVAVTYGANGRPTYVSLRWADCRIQAMFVKITVSWCGATRLSPTRLDVGFNFEKEVAWGTAQSTCWVRATLTVSQPALNGRATVGIGPTRSGC